MNNYIDLITPNYLKAFIPSINNNTDDALISHSITKMQRMQIYNIMGKLYLEDVMTTLIASGDTGLSTADLTMLTDYIRPILCLYTYSDMLIPLSFQVDNSGVRSKVVAESNSSTKSEIAYLQENTKNEISWYLEQMLYFLNDNQSDYPLYYQCKNNTPTQRSSAFTGMYFPKNYSRKSNGLDWDTTINF